ncbi:MAG TPA: 16S rRNA (guanine(966)-N(2))-methyltransferase RsmD [Rhodanobacteraceae bacterium]|nr:16S rRNA (guanine(966)-N(2))-methyltransferase RsmD [Rhodanobacteraceae bacterium]
MKRTDFRPKRASPGPSGKVRIIAGRLRGSRIVVPDRPGLRPTPDRVRETLFNWLAPVIEGARCLDLFAGTGALGIEALSRGAASCTFVESDRELARLVENHLARLDAGEARVVATDAASLLAGAPQPFDVVFLDPPFAENLWNATAARLEQGGWLAPGAWIYVESPADARIALPQTWQAHREGRAGTARHALYRRAATDPLS